MITRISTRAVCGGMLAAGLLLSGCGTTAESRADIRTDSQSALNDLYQKIPAAKGVARTSPRPSWSFRASPRPG